MKKLTGRYTRTKLLAALAISPVSGCVISYPVFVKAQEAPANGRGAVLIQYYLE